MTGSGTCMNQHVLYGTELYKIPSSEPFLAASQPKETLPVVD